jgi:RNA polymerase sigma-70 factor, ECF subfamily
MAEPIADSEFEALYREHGPAVRRICVALLRDRGEAEDAAQQVFLSAYQALLNGTGPRHPAAWLATIARHECRRRVRPSLHPIAEEAADMRHDPPGDVLRRIEVDAVWDAIAELPAAQRQALLLREITGLSYEQVAEHLDVSHSSVRSLLNRARRKIHRRVRSGSAAVGGISWIDALARLIASGPYPGAAIAARAAAVGVGAAALGSGAHVPFRHFVPPAPAATPVLAHRAASPARRSPAPATAARSLRPAPTVSAPAAHRIRTHKGGDRMQGVAPAIVNDSSGGGSAEEQAALAPTTTTSAVTTSTTSELMTASSGDGGGSSDGGMSYTDGGSSGG